MKLQNIICLVAVLLSVTTCGVPDVSPLVKAQDPPGIWKVSNMENTGCPELEGKYELIPKVATLNEDNVWEISNGRGIDLALLLPDAEQQISKVKTKNSRNTFVIGPNTKEGTIQITSPVMNSDDFVVKKLEELGNDYSCKNGVMIFPEFLISGGSEGGILSGRVHRNVTKTLEGDLVFYEQVQGQKVQQKYYLFKKVR